MHFTVEHPLGQHDCAADLCEPDGLNRFARAVEDNGYWAIAFTEHPAPSAKWLEAGGHLSLDPLAALSFCAAVTSRVRLMTYLLILPYRNPLLTAKTVATVDRLSGGRLVIGAGGGYLRAEFAAVGADFDSRGSLFDEALDVLTKIWTETGFTGQGSTYSARSVVSAPGPVQLPHPPLWIGGSGRNARRRAARVGQGWAPLMMGEVMATTTRTAALTSYQELRDAVSELWEMATAHGRDAAALDVQVYDEQGLLAAPGFSHEQRRDHLGNLADAGATAFVIRPPGASVQECCDALADFAENVMPDAPARQRGGAAAIG